MAITQARAGLAISNLNRSGYFVAFPVILINDVDRTSYIDPPSLRVTQVINDETDTAEFTIPSITGYVPTPGQTVKIGLGASNNLIFGGVIVSAEHQFEADGQATPWISVQCQDWGRMFNRRLVTAPLGGMTASAAVLYIVENFTTGFTTKRVDLAQSYVLPADFGAVNEPPLKTIRRIANLVQGGCWIHPEKDLVFWGEGGDVSDYAQTPETLVGGLWSLSDFKHSLDTSQWRTKVVAEGGSVQTVVEIPVGANLGTYGIPLETTANAGLFNASTSTEANFARIGSQTFSYSRVVLVSGPPSLILAADASPGDTSITASFSYGTHDVDYRWLTDGNGNYFVFTSTALVGPPDIFGGIPASGYGSIPIELPSGTPLYVTHHLHAVAARTVSSGVEKAIKKGEGIVVRAEVEDAAAQAAIVTIEGGDSSGVYEHTINNGDWSYVGALAAAHAETDTFGSTLPFCTWVTKDMNANVGAPQAVNIPNSGGLVATVVIQKVTFSFPEPVLKGTVEDMVASALPTRVCEGGLVKLQRVLESI